MSTKRLKVVVACCIAALPVCAAAATADGFTPLFDGKTLAGWHSFGQKGVGKDWSVVDGNIELHRDLKAPREDFADLVTLPFGAKARLQAGHDGFSLAVTGHPTLR